MEDSYQEIATILNDACPAGYEQSILKAEVGDDWSDQEVWCISGNGKKQPDLESKQSFQLGRKLRILRKEMTIPGEQPWSRCTFTLFPDGKFKFDVEYDD